MFSVKGKARIKSAVSVFKTVVNEIDKGIQECHEEFLLHEKYVAESTRIMAELDQEMGLAAKTRDKIQELIA